MSNQVTASQGSVAVGGNANNAVFNLGNGNTTQQQITNTEAGELLKQLRDLVAASALPEEDKNKALRHIETAREEAGEAAPDKAHAAKSLEKAVKILQGSGEVVDGTLTLWGKVQPVLTRIAPWLAEAGLALGL